MGAHHPSLALSLLLALSLATGAAEATESKSWLVPFVVGLLSWASFNAIQSFCDPHSGSVRAKLSLLAGLSLLLPCLAAAIPAAKWLFSESSPLFSLPANLFLMYVAFPYAALISSVRNKLPHKLTIVLAAAVAAVGVAATGWLLHEDVYENPGDSGIIGAITVLSLALVALCIGLYGARETLNLRLLLSLCSLLFLASLAATVATQFAIDQSSEFRLQLLQPLSVVSTVAAAAPLITAAFASHERHALNIGHSTRAARTIAVCRILVKIFALCSLFFSASFGFSFDSSPSTLWSILNFIALMSSIMAMNGALAYVRFKDPPLHRHPMDVRSVLLSLLAVAIAAAEIALIVLCYHTWTPFVPSTTSSLLSTTTSPLPSNSSSPPTTTSPSPSAPPSSLFHIVLPIGVLCLTAHKVHLTMVAVIDRLRGVLRPFSLYPGLALLAVSSSLILCGELTQFFPGQSGSPTIWLAASLAAATAAQLISIPAVECLKSEAAMKKRKRRELSAAFRADAKQRLLQKRAEKTLKTGCTSPSAVPPSTRNRSSDDDAIEMIAMQ